MKEYFFVHTEWTDICILDEINMTIKRKGIDDENGKYFFDNNILIANWEKWPGDDTFVYLYESYYHKIFYETYILNNNVVELTLFDINGKENNFILNTDKNIIFDKKNIRQKGHMNVDNNILTIKWNDKEEKYFKNDNDNENENKNENNLNNTDNEIVSNNNNNNSKVSKKETFPKISINPSNNSHQNSSIQIAMKRKDKFVKKNNKYYFINENKFYYKIIDININNEMINNNLYELINTKNEINLEIKEYINENIILNHIKNNNFANELSEFIDLELNFEIKPKQKKRILSLVEWGYPPFGGGENWLLNLNKIFSKIGYENYLICFSDPFKNEYFGEIKQINLEYVKIIQSPKNLALIFKLIRLINPDIINHQGVYREYFMKISNILEIPFLTGYCYWNNIVKFNLHDLNVNMINNPLLEKTDEFQYINSNSYTYVASNFVNDIIEKIYGKNQKLDVIETISLNEEFYIKDDLEQDLNKNEQIYVTLINCHHNKGGYLLEYLLKNVNINIPFQLIYTENDPLINFNYLTELINERNSKNNINILINGKIEIKSIYLKTKILLTPSLCDETFCRVAYEGMVNGIPVISTQNGNLKYLLKDYAIYIEDQDKEKWKSTIENIYNNNDIINEFKNKINNTISSEMIEKKIVNKLNEIKKSKYKLNNNNIGMIIPWADQGLGIQSRDYYISLKELGYTPHILSFRPYHATHKNIFLQTNKEEWDYKNIVYSSNYREQITYDEVLDFVHKYKIRSMIIIEATFLNIFRIALFLKMLDIKIYLVVNIECIRLCELKYHTIFDKILTNNNASHTIISNIFKDKTHFLGFHLNYPYYLSLEKKRKKEYKKIKFCCFGGLNSISRKNIDLIIKAFYEIFGFNRELPLNWELNIYIQGVEVPAIINEYKCDKIIYHVNNFSYKSIIDKYHENDVLIHLGSHEGLGLGFYEGLYTGCPILTLNWIPNNEIIKNNINGWIVDTTFSTLNDNDNGIINMGIIKQQTLTDKIIEILSNSVETIEIINNTIDNVKYVYETNKSKFFKSFINILQ